MTARGANARDDEVRAAQAPDAQTPDAQTPDAQAADAQAPDAQTPDAQTAATQPPDAVADSGEHEVVAHAWHEYVAAAQRLDAVRRTAAAIVTEQNAILKAARDDLGGIRSRIQQQQAQLLDAAGQAGTAAPVLVPGNAELNAALAALGPSGSPAAVRASLADARARLDSADAELSGIADAVANPMSPPLRNTLIYGGYAMIAALLQVLVFLATGGNGVALVLTPVLPLVVFALGWITAGAMPLPPGAIKPRRTPFIGAALSLLSLLPVATMVLWIIVQVFRGRG